MIELNDYNSQGINKYRKYAAIKPAAAADARSGARSCKRKV